MGPGDHVLWLTAATKPSAASRTASAATAPPLPQPAQNAEPGGEAGHMPHHSDRLARVLSRDRGEGSDNPRGDGVPVLAVGHCLAQLPLDDPRTENVRGPRSGRWISGAFQTADTHLDQVLKGYDADPEPSRDDVGGLLESRLRLASPTIRS